MNSSDRAKMESDWIDEAINIAARSPDLAHIVRVASRMQTIEQKLTAWLHDSVEDGYASMDDLQLLGFPNQVLVSVAQITRGDGEKYGEYIRRIADFGDYTTVVVKEADLRVNLARARVDRYSLVQRYEDALVLIHTARVSRFNLRA